MNRENMVEEVKAEIVRLQEVLHLLEGSGSSINRVRRNVSRTATRTPKKGAKRVSRPMSVADRKRRSDSQKARWANRRAAEASAGHSASGAGQPSGESTANVKSGASPSVSNAESTPNPTVSPLGGNTPAPVAVPASEAKKHPKK